MARGIYEVYELDALKERMIRKWFARFRVFSIKDAERSSRPRTVDTDKTTTLLDTNSHQKNPGNSWYIHVRSTQEAFFPVCVIPSTHCGDVP